MRNLRLFGLTLGVMAAFAALVGGSSAEAAATKLCKANEAACSAGNTYASGTKIEAETKSGTATWSSVTQAAEFVTNLGTVKCDAHIKGETTAASGEPLPGKVTSWTFTGCSITVGGVTTACTVGGGTGNANNLPYTSNIAASGSGNGTLNLTAGIGGNPGLTIVCGAIINCTFSKVPATLDLTGGAPMVANLEGPSLALGAAGSKCPSQTIFKAILWWILPNSSGFSTN
jgi:hypothetical protein